MAYTPLTEEEYNKAISSGFKPEDIVQFEKQRIAEEDKGKPESKLQIERQTLGAVTNVPGATARAAIQSNPSLAAAGPLAGLLALSGAGGKQAQQAAGQGAARPDDVPTFQNQALDSYYKTVGNGPLQTAGGFGVSAVGLAADIATDPTNVLLSLIAGLKTPKIQPTSEVIDKQFLKAVNPGTRGMDKYAKVQNLKDRARSAVESIVDNKKNLNLSDSGGNVAPGKLPETLDEFSQAISQTKKTVFNKYDAMLKDAGEQGATVPLRPIADEILTAVSHPQIEDLSPTVQNYGIELANRLQKRGTYTLTEAQDAIEGLNNKLKSYFNNPTPEALHQAVIDRAVVNHLRNALVKSVEGKTGKGYDILRRQYGALNTVEDSVTKAAVKNAGHASTGIGRMFDALSSGDIVNGILTLNPGLVTKGVFQVGVRKVFAGLNNPNKVVGTMFKNVDRIKNIDPQKRAMQQLLKNITVPTALASTEDFSKE